MKVRHKQTGAILDILDPKAYYQTPSGSVLSCEEWQLIEPPPDRWEDVTEQVEITDRQYEGLGGKGRVVNEAGCFHNGIRLTHNVCGGQYRLRKVRVWMAPAHTPVDSAERISAFLVERKVSS